MKREDTYIIYKCALAIVLLLLGGWTNMAWGQTKVDIQSITASSTANSNEVAQITLGNGNTWTSYTSRYGYNEDENPYLILDLGNSHEGVNMINITFNGNTRPAGMTVYYSNTGNNNSWQSVNYSGDVRNGSSFTLSQAVTARYIRLRFTRSGDRWNGYNAVSISDLSLAYVDMSKITITPHNGTFPHVDVPTLVDTVYVRDGEERTLVTGNYEYYWYFRWYRRNMN